MENVLSLLVQAVYRNGKPYSSLSKLQASNASEWDKIDATTLQKLIHSIPDHVFQVIKNLGD